MILILVCLFLQGCTYSINLAHTQGSATDVIDDTKSQDVKPAISVPLKEF